MRMLDLVGLRFGRLTVVNFAGKKRYSERHTFQLWECLCDCGNSKVIRGENLTTGVTKSCGCLNREVVSKIMRRHGATDTPEHSAWMQMLSRCSQRKSNLDYRSANYRNYLYHGIQVCARWQGPTGFANFLADVGPKPGPEYSLDRYPNNKGNYEPSNCRWATVKEQAANRRPTVPLKASHWWAWEEYADRIGA